jgi:undecaprenyl-phosphate 4-deoxy-4-formamido-L-arabinose transferase
VDASRPRGLPQPAPPPALAPREAEVDFSVIITCHYEERSIDEFYKRLSATLQSMQRSYEILFVNDGSTDGTFERLRAIYEADPQVSAAIDLFRNTGQANAATPGMMLARGRAFVLIDSDLQLDPEELPRLVAEYDAGAHIVTGYRPDRHDPLRRRLPSLLANEIMRRASRTRLRDFGCTFKIYDGALVRGFEFGPFKPWRPVPVIAAAGRIAEVPVTHHERRFGQSGWTFRKLFAYNMENLVNLSERVFQYLGAICLALALLFVLRILSAFVVDTTLVEVTPGLVLNVVIVSLLITTAILSAIGEFVTRNFIALQRKPAFLVRTLLQRHPG